MKTMNLARLMTFLVFGMMQTMIAMAAETKDPQQVIRESTDRVLATIEKQKASNGGKVADGMAEELLDVLEPVVDFAAIARGVMGSHAKLATPEQTQKFETVFKDSMAQLYAKSFEALEVEKVTILDPAPDFDPARGRATVQAEATTTDGKVFSLSYSMRSDAQHGWRVRNIIVDGINLGLTYLNQFDGAMKRYGNDIGKVISTWTAEMESK
ncbi:MAG: ABC transporter substrate-binding protein [Pseudomonadales bacterium]|nr:ABC transporter substrate-binding protein [Pseudomonadales bacterium]